MKDDNLNGSYPIELIKDQIDYLNEIAEERRKEWKQHSVYEKEIWNKAIDECLMINAIFGGSTEQDEIIRRLKK